MRLSDIAEATLSHLVGRVVRRAIGFAAVGLLAIVMFYYASAAAVIALAIKFGTLYAYLIMAGIYAAAAADRSDRSLCDPYESRPGARAGRERPLLAAQYADRDAGRSGHARLFAGAQIRQADYLTT